MSVHALREAFRVRGKMPRSLDTLIGLIAILIAFAVWFILTHGPSPDKRLVRGAFLPSPMDIASGAQELAKNGYLLNNIFISISRIFQGMLITTAIGVPIGILMGSIPVVDSLLRKFIDGGKSVPPTAFLGLIILWVGIEEKSKIVFLFLGAIFYMILMTKNAIQNVREDFITIATDIGANRWQVIQKVLLPGAIPQIWDAIIVCNGLMWTYIVLAEWVNAQSGLGYMISIASRLSRSDQVYAGVIIIALVSASTDWLLRSIKKRFFDW